MARTAKRLTRRQVEQAVRGKLLIRHQVTGEPTRGRMSDGDNLYLALWPNGHASWVFNKMVAGKRVEVVLGEVRKLGADAGSDDPAKIAAASLAKARELAAEKQAQINDGARLSQLKKAKQSKVVAATYTFDDMAAVYEKQKGPFTPKRQNETKRLIAALKAAAPEVEDVRDFTKAHARLWRDTRKDQVSAESVERENNVIKSMFSIYFTESDIEQANPFVGLKMPEKNATGSAMSKRVPLTIEEIRAIRKEIYAGSRAKEVGEIWDVLTLTGARGAEVQGLRVQDVHLDADIPHISITPTDDRGVKTAGSVRLVPLYGAGLEAARNALKRNEATGYLFGKDGMAPYGNVSMKLMKHFRKHVADERKVVHSLRHSIVDLFREHDVPAVVAAPFTGHVSNDVADRVYGSPEKQLVRTHNAVKGILEAYSDAVEDKVSKNIAALFGDDE